MLGYGRKGNREELKENLCPRGASILFFSVYRVLQKQKGYKNKVLCFS
jgi:hypothetical protein